MRSSRLFTLAAALIGGASCSEAAINKPAEGTGVLKATIPLGSALKQVGMEANSPKMLTRAFKIPADVDLGAVKRIAVDLKATLPHVTIVRTDTSSVPPELRLKVAVRAGADTVGVCETGATTSMTIRGDATFQDKIAEPEMVTPPAAVLDALSQDSFSVCFEATSTVNLMVSLDAVAGELELEPERCAEPTPEDVSGAWSGTYTCKNTCEPDESGNIVLSVLQSKQTALYYDDGGALYFGTVCGNRFSHVGGKATYLEGGKLEVTGENTATKTSHWTGTFDASCGGDCSDQLTKSK